MPTANVNGQVLHYLQRGEGEPLLLIQGMSGTHLSWGDDFLDELARDFRLTIFDNRGMGSSGRADDPFTIADMAADAAALLEELGIERAHVLGISMGGMIAQQLALDHPERIATLTLGCTYSGGPGSELTPPETGRRLVEAWTSGDRERAIRTGWEINVAPEFAADDARYARFREAVLDARAPLEVIQLQARAVGGHDVLDRLGDLAVPTLVVHGDLDGMLPVANGRLIASRIPGARLEILEGVGHLFWIEQPQRSAALIREHARAAAAAG